MFYVIWTARLAVFAWLAVIGLRLTGRLRRMAQVVWTAGFFLFCGHVVAAFHFIHDWSHTAAWQHTADQTKAVTGWDWGGGIWFNYLFLLLWGLDVLLGRRRITAPDDAKQPLTTLSLLIQFYLAFIVFDATVVFGPFWWWPAMTACAIVFFGIALYRHSAPR